jgi:transglutaminase-like putative cysteine protease
VRQLARELVTGGSTPFERALLLEAYFRDPGQFTYSTGVDTGHSSLDLEDWLTDPDSRNYRTGYCEQFATAMGVLARAIGIPSRVVLGFTPGDIETQADGSEVVVVGRTTPMPGWSCGWTARAGCGSTRPPVATASTRR